MFCCFTTRLLCLVLISYLVAPSLMAAQQAHVNKLGSTTTEDPLPQDTQGPFLRAVFNTNADQGDYIPCEFSQNQLLNLRPNPIVDYLTPFEAEEVKEAVVSAALSQANAASFSDGNGLTFSEAIGGLNLEGRTRSEALASVIDLLRQYQANAVKAAALAATPEASGLTETLKAVTVDNSSPSDAEQKVSSAIEGSVKQIQQGIADLNAKRASAQDKLEVAKRAYKDASDKADTAKKVFDAAAKTKTGPTEQEKQAVDDTGTVVKSAKQKYDAAETAASEIDSQLQSEQEALSTAQASSQKAKSAAQQAAQEQGKSAQAVVDSARNTIAALSRPLDVGCAMSVLSWKEVEYSFGGLIANEYIAVQVVVRNLNETKQFLIHDSELGVDSDINGRIGRFYSGRDQKIVRQLAIAEQSYSVRNLIVNTLAGIGTIASAALPLAAISLKDATGVYNGGFMPALSKAWPDYAPAHANLVSDIGFSASTDDKAVLVPKSGAAVFVMFVPSKPFEQGWWTQSCAEDIATHPSIGGTQPSTSGTQRNIGQMQTRQVGIDLQDARNACQKNQRFKREHYRDWSPTADDIFRELAFAVVSGVHIAEETKTTPTVSQIECPKDTIGNVDFSKQVKGSISCSLTGANLDQVVKLRLRDAADATDNATAEGSVTPSGDSTKGNVDFPLTQIGPLEKPDYKVYAVNKTGAEDDAKQTLHFNVTTPFFLDVTQTAVVNLPKDKPNTTAPIELTGYHLDKIGKQDKIQLSVGPTCAATAGTETSSFGSKSSGTTWSEEFSLSNPTPLKASFDVVPGKTEVSGSGKLEICYHADSKQPQDLKLFIVVSGMYPATPPAPTTKATKPGKPAPKPTMNPTENKPAQSPKGTTGGGKPE
jgi:hypothetical protein